MAFISTMKLFLVIGISLLASCGKKKIEPPISDDFESLSGKELPTWQHVQTKEDFEHLDFFKKIYETQRQNLNTDISSFYRIPKIIHFIWLGPNPFPRASVDNVRGWAAKHPDWTLKFWTDRPRPNPIPSMQQVSIRDLPLTLIRDCLHKSDNYAEKSDLLRLEILYQEGGIYVDHDVKCFKAFDPLNTAYDFYCGIDMPFHSSLPSCIFPTNNLIGAKRGHPILLKSMELLNSQWDTLQEAYPGADREALLNRVLHRTFWLFGEAIKIGHNQEGNRDIVFPAYYFDAPNDALALWSRHLYAGLWHETESPFEKMVRQRLMYLSKKSNKTLLILGVISSLNILGFIFLFYFIRKRIPHGPPPSH